MFSTLRLIAAGGAVFALSACSGSGPPRTVSGTFMIIYQPETGAPTIVPAPPDTDPYLLAHHLGFGYQLQGLLVPNGSPSGYATFPATLGPDFSFSVPNVPSGSYFLTLTRDCQSAKCFEMTELTASTPDLSMRWPCRPDIAYATQNTNVALELSEMQPWTDRDRIEFNSSQACLGPQYAWNVPPRPSLGATSFGAVTLWYDALPDGTKGDVVFVSQKSGGTLGGGSALTLVTSRAARLTDFSVADGGTASLRTALSVPPAGAFRLDLRWSQFARLAADVNPSAVPSYAISELLAVPPNARNLSNSALLAIASMATVGPTEDVDYGTLAYGQFLDSSWRELRKYVYAYQVSIPFPASPPIARTLFIDGRAFSSAGLPTVPALSPPKAPQINGMDAFRPRAGVGLQPVLSWSNPAIGTPTSYGVEIEQIPESSDPGLPVRVYSTAIIRSGTSFKVPPDFLQSGSFYLATITALMARGDIGDRLQMEADWSSAPCITAAFSP